MATTSKPSSFALFAQVLDEARARGFGPRAFAVARGVYTKRTGEDCPFFERPPETVKTPEPVEAPPRQDAVAAIRTDPLPAVLMPICTLDFETRSRAELKDVGTWRYAADASTTVLCLAWSIGDAVELWTPELSTTCPRALAEHIAAGGLLEAHNAEFEIAVWHNVCHARMGWPAVPTEQWRCSMARVAAYALPLSLAGAAKALSLDQQKDVVGAAAMRRLCKPRRPSKNNPSEWFEDPADYAALYTYCQQDVRTEHAIAQAVPPLSAFEQSVWTASLRLNQRGAPIDRAAIGAVLRMLDLARPFYDKRLRLATGGQLGVDDLSRRDHLLTWLRGRGVVLDALAKADVDDALDESNADDAKLPSDVRTVLEARRATARTSTAKYQAMLDRADADDRIRGMLVYHGAATGRWAGRGVQPQNFPRESVDDVDAVLSAIADVRTPADLERFQAAHGDPYAAAVGCLRGCFKAPRGSIFVACDYAQIEARVLLWLADDPGVDLFRRKADIYREMAAAIYGVPLEEIDKAQRHVGKTAILGLGFGMGAAKFHATCQKNGIHLPSDLIEHTVKTYRAKFARVRALWSVMEDAAVQAVNAPGTVYTTISTAGDARAIRWKAIGNHLFCRLPSGRRLCYPFARLVPRRTPWGDERQAVSFMAENAVTHQWESTDTYGGKLVENVVQAIARDVLAAALVRADAADWRPIMLVHDELVAELPLARFDRLGGPAVGSHGPLAALEALMCELPPWAAGLPVAAEGWYGPRYRK